MRIPAEAGSTVTGMGWTISAVFSVRSAVSEKKTPKSPSLLAEHTQGLPDWLVQELTNYQNIQQRNWRPTRLYGSIRRFWSSLVRTWRFLCDECGVSVIQDITRQDLFDYIELRLDVGKAVSGITGDIRSFHLRLSWNFSIKMNGILSHRV